jgi:serine-type D-Ala-D-Ala carboxypeptidase (penicillin-binding protein 5/6)
MSFCSRKDFSNQCPKRFRMKCLLYGLLFLTTLFLSSLPAYSEAMIRSRSAIVVEAFTGKILYAKDPNCQLPPASTAKLITAILTIEKLDPSGVLVVGKEAARVNRPRAFKKDDRVSIEQVLYAALIKSANDAAVALAEAVAGSEKEFVNLMNQKAISIGAVNTKFINASGLPGPGQYTTVLDLSTIMRYALGYPKIREIIGTSEAHVSTAKGKNVVLRNTDELLRSEKNLMIGGKTGFTVEAGHCFVGAAEHENKRIIVALLGSPSRRLLWKEAEELIHKGLNSSAEVGRESRPAGKYLEMMENKEPLPSPSLHSPVIIDRTPVN